MSDQFTQDLVGMHTIMEEVFQNTMTKPTHGVIHDPILKWHTGSDLSGNTLVYAKSNYEVDDKSSVRANTYRVFKRLGHNKIHYRVYKGIREFTPGSPNVTCVMSMCEVEERRRASLAPGPKPGEVWKFMDWYILVGDTRRQRNKKLMEGHWNLTSGGPFKATTLYSIPSQWTYIAKDLREFATHYPDKLNMRLNHE